MIENKKNKDIEEILSTNENFTYSCPECLTKNQIIHDTQRGEYTCSECGLILSERRMVSQTQLSFEGEKNINTNTPCRGLLGGKKVFRINDRYFSRRAESKSNRTEQYRKNIFDIITQNLIQLYGALPKNIKEKAEEIYTIGLKEDLGKYIVGLDGLVISAYSLSFSINNRTFNYTKIRNIFNFDRNKIKKIKRTKKDLEHFIKKENLMNISVKSTADKVREALNDSNNLFTDINTWNSIETNKNTAVKKFNKISKANRYELNENLESIMLFLENSKDSFTGSPKTAAAAILYLAVNNFFEKTVLTERNLANLYGLSDVSIRTRKKIIEDAFLDSFYPLFKLFGFRKRRI